MEQNEGKPDTAAQRKRNLISSKPTETKMSSLSKMSKSNKNYIEKITDLIM